jgi:hypothetical protein
LVSFLLLLENIVNYSKYDINKGYTPQEVYKICACLRETFCLSYKIRKDNVLYVYFQKEHFLIKFEGKSLRYLGPDERSQALLLNKALLKLSEKIDIKYNKWMKSTPGIYSKKFSNDSEFIDYLEMLSSGKFNLIIGEYHIFKQNDDIISFDKQFTPINEIDFFIIPIYKVQEGFNSIFEIIKKLKNLKIVSLPMIKPIADKILYINFRKDQQGNS